MMTMKRSLYLAVACAALAGCGSKHLAPDVGVSYRAALAAQRDSTSETSPVSPALSATDAQSVLTVHRGKSAGDGKPVTSSGPAAPVSSVTAPIHLEAK